MCPVTGCVCTKLNDFQPHEHYSEKSLHRQLCKYVLILLLKVSPTVVFALQLRTVLKPETTSLRTKSTEADKKLITFTDHTLPDLPITSTQNFSLSRWG